MFTQYIPPQAITRTLKYLSSCTLPVSMLIIGSILAEVNIKRILSKSILYFSGIRLLVIPVITLAICHMLHVDELATGICVILAGMPAGSTTAILAEKYDGDALFASRIVFFTTMMSLITIPILFWII